MERWGSSVKNGDRCGDYTIQREIARGGMGVVYLATDAAGEERAIKTLLPKGRKNDIHDRFRREIQLLSYLDHVHVVRFYDAGILASGEMWVALEYLGGETLRDITRGRFPYDVRTVLRWGRQICKGVGEAHKIGVIHRDLKPANIALVERDLVKVFDFGIAKFHNWGVKRTRPGIAMGTLLYMAPEQLNGEGSDNIDARCDVYAIGTILYELLAGRHPLVDPGEQLDPSSMVFRVLTQDPESLTRIVPGFPVDVAGIVAKAMNKSPSERYASASALDDALSDALRMRARESTPFTEHTTQRDLGGGTEPIRVATTKCVFADSVSHSENPTRVVVPFPVPAPRTPPPVVSSIYAPRVVRGVTAVLFLLSLCVLGFGVHATQAPVRTAQPSGVHPLTIPSVTPPPPPPVTQPSASVPPQPTETIRRARPAPPVAKRRPPKPKGPQPIFTRPLDPLPPKPSAAPPFIPGAVPDF